MEKISLKNRKDQKIIGVLEKPEGRIKGTCIVQHGWGGHKNKPTVQAIKNAFLESGFQTFNFDATNSFGESDGDFEKSNLGLHWEDLEDVVKWARKQKWFKDPLALSGHSTGGYAVVRYAEEYPDEVYYLVPVAPVVSGTLSFEAYQKYKPKEFEQWKKDGVLEIVNRDGQIRRQHWFQMEERLHHNLLPHVKRLTMPTLLIVGSKDDSCLEQTHILFNSLPKDNKTMEVIDGAPHSYHKKSEQEACTQAIKNWLTNNM